MKKILLALCCALIMPLPAQAAYPERPIKLIVPFPAGSGTDTVARELAEEMTADLGQPIVVDNRGGAQGIIGMNGATAAAPDGYTLVVLGVTTGATNVSMNKNLPYDPVKDLTPIGMIADSPIVLVAAPGFGPNNTADLFKLGREQPGKLNWAYGSGSAQMAGVKLLDMGKIQAQGVSYRGSPQALTDVMSGQVQFMFVDMSLAVPQMQGGKLKALGVTSKDRFPLLPAVPTINESGAPGYDLVVWFALAGPAKLPQPVVERLSKALNKALDSKALQEKYATHGLAVKHTTPAQFGEFLKSEIVNWGDLVRKAGIQPQ
jgi:tripartite-type tricarboxylate transporter receptor subunit TctC